MSSHIAQSVSNIWHQLRYILGFCHHEWKTIDAVNVGAEKHMKPYAIIVTLSCGGCGAVKHNVLRY